MPGSTSMTARYQNRITSSGGMLRKISMYTVAIARISQLLESREMPTMSPRIVAMTIEKIDAMIVSTSPASSM